MLNFQIRFIFTLIIAITLTACVTFGPQNNKPYKRVNLPKQQQYNPLNSKLTEIDRQLTQEPDPRKRQALLLSKSDTLIQLGRFNEAKLVFKQINNSLLPQPSQVLYLINKSDLLAYNRQYKQALRYLPVDKPHFSKPLKKRLYITQIRVLEGAGFTTHATKARIQLQPYFKNTPKYFENGQTIYDQLKSFTPAEIQKLNQTSPEMHTKSWLDFIQLSSNARSRPQFDQQLMNWLDKYPDHCVPESLIRSIQSNINDTLVLSDDTVGLDRLPSKLALLLPYDGQYAQISKKIEQGFEAAISSSSEPEKPILLIKPVDLNLQEQALNLQNQGVDMIVGPLSKQNVEILHNTPGLNIPVLALNRMTGAREMMIRPQFYQFGLIPDDELIQMAHYAIGKDLHGAAIIAPSNPLGERLANAFTSEFESLGGTVYQRATFDPKARDFGPSVRQALDITTEDIRNAARMKKKTKARSADYRKYITDELDLIVMIASPTQARGIIPQLHYYDAEHLTVLSNSMVYDGRASSPLNIDLNNVQFTYPSSKQEYDRFYALGHDAYVIISSLARSYPVNSFDENGLSGHLSFGRAGIIHRELPWLIFKDGSVEPAN